MGFMDLAVAAALAQGLHTGGHFAEASQQGLPISLHGKELSEHWNQPSPKLNVDMDGAGFQMQDEVLKKDANTNESYAPIVSALIKAGYLADLPTKLSHGAVEGDINRMERQSGNRHVDKLVALSALDDLVQYKNPKRNWGIDFSTFGTGQPGLKFNYRW